jgi:hypothetical protein
MKILSAALVVGMLIPLAAHAQAPVPAKQYDQFQADYLKHVNTANAALGDFMSADCDKLDPYAKKVAIELEIMHGQFKSIPDDEDSAVQVIQIELYDGLLVVTREVVDTKTQECAAPDVTVPTNSKS